LVHFCSTELRIVAVFNVALITQLTCCTQGNDRPGGE
jgi:hypothetical protein